MNPSFQRYPPVVKFMPEGGIRGDEKPAPFLFLNVTAWKQILEMTCNDFQTELTSGTRKKSCGSLEPVLPKAKLLNQHQSENNLFETVSLKASLLA